MRNHHNRLKKLEGNDCAVQKPKGTVIFDGHEQTVDEVREEYKAAGKPLPDNTFFIALIGPELDENGRAIR